MQQLNELKNELTKDFGTIAVDSNIQADVSKYKEMGVFGRWIYRAFTDNQILDKVRLVACNEIVAEIQILEDTLSEIIQSSKQFYNNHSTTAEPTQVHVDNMHRCQKILDETKTKIDKKIDEVIKLSEVRSYKGKDANYFQTLKEDIEESFNTIKTNISFLFRLISEGNFLGARSRNESRNENFPPVISQPKIKEKPKKLSVIEKDSPEVVLASSEKSKEIQELFNKLTEDEKSAFEEKHPTDFATQSLICDPVVLGGNDKVIYERESIKEHINRQLEGNPKDIKDPYNTLHPVNDHNLSLTAQTDLQEKILQDLKSFYQEKYPEDSSDVSHVTHRP